MSWAANPTGDYEPEPPNGVALTGGTAFEVAIAVGSSIVVVTSVANVIPPATATTTQTHTARSLIGGGSNGPLIWGNETEVVRAGESLYALNLATGTPAGFAEGLQHTREQVLRVQGT